MIHKMPQIKLRFITDKLVKLCKKPTSVRTAKMPAVGLEIGPKEIRAVIGNIEVTSPTPEGAVLDGVIVERDKVAEAIKGLFKSKGILNKNVVTAVGGRGVVLHLTSVPSMGPDGIKDIIKDEASKYMVFAGVDLLTDFYPIEEISEGGSKRLRVLSVIAKKEIIDSYVECIKLAQLNLQAIDAASLAIARAVFSKESLSSGITVLAVVEYETAVIFIFKDGKIHYLHNVDSTSQLDSEIESIITYCRNEFGENVNVKKIVSTDIKGVSIAKGLALRETKEVKFPVKINLLPFQELRIKEFNRQAVGFVKVLGVLVAVLVFFFFFLRFQTWLTFRNIAAIQDTLKKPDPALDKLLDIESMSKDYEWEMKNQENIISKAKKEDWGRILEEIKRVIPKNAYLSSIRSDEKDTVTFRGGAVNQNTAFDFIRSLKGSPLFKDVRLEESKSKKIEEELQADFVIKCHLETIIVENRNR